MATAENVWAWSATAGSNDAADSSINWTEGQDPATVNNSARSMMAATKKWANVNSGNVGVAGTANAIQITTNQSISSGHQALGFRICFKAGATNTGATTVAVDALSPVAIKRPNGDALSAGDIVSGGFFDIAFDGTNYKLLAATGAAGTYGALAGVNNWSGQNIFTTTTYIGDTADDYVVIKGQVVSTFGTQMLAASSASAWRVALALGTAAEYNIGQIGFTVPLLGLTNTWGAGQAINTATEATPLALTHPASTTSPNLYSSLTGADGAGYYQASFLHNGAIHGSITQTSFLGSGSVAYNTTSDDRLKHASTPLADSGAIIDQLAPIRFRWGRDDGPEDFGFSAQALHAVVPQAVVPGKGNPGDKDFIPWQMAIGRLEAILVAEIKALRARVAALEAAA